MNIACWVPSATHSEYVILIAFPLQQWLYELASLLRYDYIACIVDNQHCWMSHFNPLTPNDPYIGRTAQLTSKCYILYIYLTNIGTEYFKHGIYSSFFLFKMQFLS